MKKYLLLFFLFTGSFLDAQIEHTRYHFAQSYLGFEMQYLPGTGSLTIAGENGEAKNVELPALFQPRLTIGGLHFWRHADFYMSFPVGKPFPFQKEAWYTTNPALGARYYPFALLTGKPRVFAGINWSVFKIAYGQSAPVRERHFAMLEAGAAWKHKRMIFEFTGQYFSVHRVEYAYSRTKWNLANMPQYSLSAGIKWVVDGTAGLSGEAGQEIVRKRRKALTDNNKMSGLTLTVGPSTAMGFTRSEYQRELRPWMQNKMSSILVPELGIGYYHHQLATEARLVYRMMRFKAEGFGLKQDLMRHAAGIEVIHFFFDYNGFVPFLGAGCDMNIFRFRETDNGATVTSHDENKAGATVAVGWDIRPSGTENMVLRTTLRYSPKLHIDVNGKELMADHFEFNFIEFVFYPGRKKAIKNFSE